jgi:sec-independent protein translocase protein TatA
MQAVAESVASFAFIIGGWEVVVILAVIVMLFGAKRLPDLARGLGRGLSEFDRGAHDAGESLGGIFGKGAAEAITPDNQVAELYEPAALGEKEMRKPGGFWRRLCMRIGSFFARWERNS